MAEYINREATIKAIVDSRNRYYNSASNQYLVGRCDGLDIAAGLLRVAPAADVAPVVHGRWEMRPTGMVTDTGPEYKAYCTVCNKPNKQYQPPFCPHCGAKMDGGDNTER